ncbi:hypothetical protein NQ314_011917 [Rhamnusium bicolor]|uniref:PiggyBac transposable element-derived protein domain-containing protein n=1 Tax=Rhamnusium bicolor TaxID=1586634 RepID=A0AAV8XH62_9CUCU|nr:hypothetical protein NQ314_011917 [Rhamnusium bicolor]
MKTLFHQGRILFTDNFYTTVNLAQELLNRKTHLVGTLKKNRKLNPTEVTNKKFKKGEIIARELNGIVILKWQDKSDVLCLNTNHIAVTTKVKRRGEEIGKPTLICDYNNSKSFIDLSNQLKAYSSPLRKEIKWYRKLGFELLLETSLVNAPITFQLTV